AAKVTGASSAFPPTERCFSAQSRARGIIAKGKESRALPGRRHVSRIAVNVVVHFTGIRPLRTNLTRYGNRYNLSMESDSIALNLNLVGALFVALVARPAAAREVKPYEVVYCATVSESLCLLLPGQQMT